VIVLDEFHGGYHHSVAELVLNDRLEADRDALIKLVPRRPTNAKARPVGTRGKKQATRVPFDIDRDKKNLVVSQLVTVKTVVCPSTTI
jgi:hypothetical protein